MASAAAAAAVPALPASAALPASDTPALSADAAAAFAWDGLQAWGDVGDDEADKVAASLRARLSVGPCSVCLEDDCVRMKVHGEHSFCMTCLTAGFQNAVATGDLPLHCLECQEEMDVEFVHQVFRGSAAFDTYNRLLLLRTLQRNPLVRFCPSPDCTYAVECHSNQSNCPRLTCPMCEGSFCFTCRQTWHSSGPCKVQEVELVKACPQCGVSIFKEQDGSCNQMRCSVCKTEFCWLCLKKMSTINGINHYTSLSGCTMFGASRWSERKMRLWQASAPVAAPLVVAGMAAVFAIALVGVPAMLARDTYRRNRGHHSKPRRLFRASLSSIFSAAITTPVLAFGMIGLTLKVLSTAYIKMPFKLIKGAVVSKRAQQQRLGQRVDESQMILSGKTDSTIAAAVTVTDDAAAVEVAELKVDKSEVKEVEGRSSSSDEDDDGDDDC
eukprot:m.75688 g.75688  ORF g.75688 m.75688 type:complete len:441 (-) comp14601_c0_seq1:346-1668(-)